MIIGIPKEIKNNEMRVAATPAIVHELVNAGHTVYVEKGAGSDASFPDKDYVKEGAKILDTAEDVWKISEMIVKVKEPLKEEYKYFRKDLIIFTYFHLAAEEELTKALVDSGAIAIAYETVEGRNGSLPLLAPMSEIAGRMAVQNGIIYLEQIYGGKGILVDGVTGVAPGHIVILGAGSVGTAACRRAVGLGARVTILDISIPRLTYINDVYKGRVETLYSNAYNLREAMSTADLVIGCVLIPGSKAPKLIKEDMLKVMPKGGVVVDVAIDQGGCLENVVPTTHSKPVYKKKGQIIYAVTNIPGAVPQTATLALTNATQPYINKIANMGWRAACKKDAGLAKGINVINGLVTFAPVAEAFNYSYTNIEAIL